jgi:hypothetical protein
VISTAWPGCLIGGLLLSALVRPVSVIVPRVLGERLPQMLLAEDQHVVQALAVQCSHESLRVGVRSRRPDRCLDHPRAVADEDAVERGGELAVPVANEEPEVPARSPRSIMRLRACWAVQAPVG